ncbi:MAG: DUF4139 domain-containing protein [Ignavibacteriales bacterium]|nr:DUF4139 domain-containing protein [Ignavibacteriales bacterium]
MKQIALLISALTLTLPIIENAQDNNQKEIAVTVYNNNLGVIKDIRNINLNSGLSKISITDVAQYIDPTSVHIKFDGEVLEQNYQYDLVDLNKILMKYIDKNVQMINENNELVEGKLLSALGNQIVLENKEGGLVMLPSTEKYRFNVGALPEGLITKPTLVWQLNSNKSGNQDVEISYQTHGMNWHAEYVAVLNNDDKKLDLNAWVSIENNSGSTYKNAKLKLVAGDVNMVRDQRPLYKGQAFESVAMDAAAPQFAEKDFFEYHIYNLQRPTTLAQNESKQISLFEAQNIDALKKYIYNANGYNSNGKINVIVEFQNKENQKLGVPMPKGKVRVYKSDGESIEFIGEDLIDHTPKNETIKLKIGDAFDLLAEETQTEHKQITNKIYEQTFEIKLKNRKKENVEIEVERYLGLNWEIMSKSHEFKKKNAQTITFNIPVKADGETTLTYKVRYSN